MNTNNQIESKNLEIIEDQLNNECLLNKKYSQYAQYCTDPQLKTVCETGAQRHKKNFTDLKNYLDSHN